MLGPDSEAACDHEKERVVTNNGRSGRDIPALLLGSGITTLGVVRCLGRAGIESYCASDDLGVAGYSRWCRRAPERLGAGDDLGAYLSRSTYERAVLFPCTDQWLVAATSLDPSFAGRFPTSIPPKRVVEDLVDKERLARVLERTDVPRPRSIEIASARDIESAPDDVLASGFLKPTDSKAFFARHRAKALSISSRDDALAKWSSASAEGFVFLLQEYVPGPASNHFFVDGFVGRDGRVLASFARQRLRMHPPLYGNSSAMISVPIERVASAARDLERLLAALEYRGIYSAEFKYDDRDGRFKLLEINARAWWYVEFAARCGVDVCSMAYRDALGLPVAPLERYESGILCVNTRTDVAATMRMVRQGAMRSGEALAALFGSEKVIFQRDDPLPALGDIAMSARKWYRRPRGAAR